MRTRSFFALGRAFVAAALIAGALISVSPEASQDSLSGQAFQDRGSNWSGGQGGTCVFSQGYWRNHAGNWPVDSLALGRASNPEQVYSKRELLGLLGSPPRGDASLILATQLIAAKLNVANGSNLAPIAEQVAHADTLLTVFPRRLPYRIPSATPLGSDMTRTASALEAYNLGLVPGSCTPVNHTPVAHAGSDQTVPLNRVVTLNGSGSSDPDGDALTFAWAFVEKPAGSAATLADPHAVHPTFVVDVPGDFAIELLVSDGTLTSAPDRVRISTVNSPPVADAGDDTTARVLETVTVDGSRSHDVDGDPLSFHWSRVFRPEGSGAALSDPAAVRPAITLDRPGDYVIQLVVHDGTDASDPDRVTVSTVNSPPVANAGADQNVFVGVAAQLDGSGSTDVDGNALAYAWSLTTRPVDSAATIADPAAVNPTFTPDVAGEYVAQLIVGDGTVESSPDTVTLTTSNRAPVASPGLPQTLPFGAIAQLDGRGSRDPDGDPLTFSWALVAAPVGSAATLSDPASATPAFALDVRGEYVAQLIVNDGHLNSVPATVTISTENSTPVADAGANQTVETGVTIQLDGSGSFDPDGTPLAFGWSLLSRPAASAAVIAEPSIVNPTFVADVDGLYVAQLIVGDGILLSAADTMTVTAQSGADLAVSFVNAPVGTLEPGASVAFSVRVDNLGPLAAGGVTARFQAPPGYTVISAAPSGGTFDAGSGDWSIGTLDAGSASQLDLQASVNAAGATALTASLTGSSRFDPNAGNNTASAAPINRPPVARAGGDQGISTGAQVALNGGGSSDADGDALSFQWTLLGRPAGSTAVLSGANTAAATFTGDRTGDFIVELVVTDAHGSSAADTVTVTAGAANRPPIITSTGVTTGAAGAPYAYQATAIDPDPGDVLTFSLPIAPAGMTIDPVTGLIQWTPLGGQTGLNHVAVHVRDRGGLLAIQAFIISVDAGASNEAPAAQDDRYDARTGDSLSVAAPGVLGNDSDPDGNRLRARALTQPANGNAVLNADGSFTYTPFTFQEGELVLAEKVNLATNLAGTTVRASTFQDGSPPENAVDSSLATSWLTLVADNANFGPRSRTGGLPFIEVAFPHAVEVNELQALGHRDGFIAGTNSFILGGTFQLFDESGAEIFNSSVDLSTFPHDATVAVPDLLRRNRNIARTEPGVAYRASSVGVLDGSDAASAFDGDLRTQWLSGFGAALPQFLEVEFPTDTMVHRVRIFGNRFITTQDFLAFFVQVFDAAGTVVFDSGTITATPDSSDAIVEVGGVGGARRVRVTGTVIENPGSSGGIAELEVISTETVTTRLNGSVRRARFTDTLDSTLQVGLSEFRVIGSALMRRERRVEPNLTQLLPTTVRASSSVPPFNPPENVIDDTVARNWYAASGAAGEFIELEFPLPTTVGELVVTNPTARPDGFGTSLTINCSGNFVLMAGDGAVLFDSGLVNQPSGALSAQFPFTLPVGNVAGVKRVRYTSAGCDASSFFPPGFSELRVIGTADVSAPPIVVKPKFQALLGREVHSTPIVANLTDDNGDGRIDQNDTPDIVVAAEATHDQLVGEIKVISGADGAELATMGAPDLVSPWSEPAVGDLDGDGRPEIVAVHTNGNHLIAFEANGAVKWLSDANPMPQFALGAGVDVGAVAIANLDAAGPPEVVVGASVFDAAGRLLGDGRALGGTTGGTGLRSRMSAVADVDLDGTPELVAGPTAYRLAGGALSIVWHRADRPDGYVAVANFDDDPFGEIVIVADGAVYMLNHDGSDAPYWNAGGGGAPVPLPGGGQGGAPTVADLDGDGLPEIGVAGAGYYTIFSRDGSVRWQAVISDRTSNATGSTVFDLDGDGSVEVIYRDEVNLRVYRGTDGVLLAKLPIGSSTWAEMPVVADVDNDGHADIVVVSDNFILTGGKHSGLYVLQDVANRWVRTRRIFNQHSYHVTNVNEDASIPTTETPHFTLSGLNSFRLNTLVPEGDEDTADRFTYVAGDGGLESAPATVRLAVRRPNSPPRITSAGPANAAAGVLYLYDAVAVDPDAGDILTFSLPAAPAGMTIDAASGLVRWTPGDTQRGTHEVVVKVQDVRGLYALQGYSVLVTDPIVVPDVVGAVQGSAASSIVSANLVIGSIVTRHSPTVPLDTVVSQSPAAGTLVARLSSVDLVVSLGPAPAGTVPDVVGQQQASAQVDIVAAGFTVGTLTGVFDASVPAGVVRAQNPAGGSQAPAGAPIGLTVSLGAPPGERDLDGDGFTGDQGDCRDTDAAIHPGAVDVPGDGIDQNCNGVDSIVGDNTPPTAQLISPDDLAEITMPVDIVGTATDANFLRYTLSFAEVDSPTFTSIGSGSAPVTGGVLGRLDPTLLENGLYRVRLAVEDVNGQVSVDERVYQVDGMAKVGNLRLTFKDLSVPVAGIPITVFRTYDSRVKTQEDFGIGWTLDITRGSYRHNRTPGQGWVISDRPFLGDFLPCIGGSIETRSHLTTVRLSDRESYTFALDIANGNLGITGACEGTASFRFVDGTRPGATLEILDGTSVIYLRGGDDTLLDMNAFLDGTHRVFDPQRVRLTTIDGTRIELERQNGVTRITDLNGNELRISAQGIVHSSGKSIGFTRDDRGRITQITSPDGDMLRYAYDGQGDLTAFTDQAGNETRFAYDARHNLISIVDGLGRSSRVEYDAGGRLVAVVDASGQRTAMDHDLDLRRETLTDRLGNLTVLEYDTRGNITRRVDALGHATTFTYDPRDNLLSETDPLGHTRTYTYDGRDNMATVTDAVGGVTTFTHNERSQRLTKTDPRGGVATRVYDSRGNLLQDVDAAGATVSHRYDSPGRRIRTTNAVGATWTYGHDSAGHVVRTTTPLGDVIDNTRDANASIATETRYRVVAGTTEAAISHFSYDALGRRTQIINAVGAVHGATYTATGQIASQLDPCCGETVHTYDEQDRLIRSVFADGTSESIAYDAEGRVVARTDRAGRTTRLAYDPLGRLLTTTFPDGATTGSEYDAAGRKTADIDSLGRTTRFTYDAEGRMTSMRDPLGGTTSYTYDAVGNRTSATDRNGRTTAYSYDAENRLVRTTFPDGTSVSHAFDGEGRRISETDQAGNVRRFEYDLRGALTGAIDALGHATRYEFNELDRRISQTDPLGNTTRFAYDLVGRRTSTTLPLGQTETRTYTVAGRLATLRDFNGRLARFEYDGMSRLTERTLSTGEVHRFAYTATDRIAAITDATGTTQFGYDDRDRPVLVRRPDGAEIRYSYDAAGNRTGVETPAGRVDYGYDANDRLVELTDFEGRRSTFAYDAEGNRTSIGYANGLIATYAYDTLNRTTGVTHTRGSQTLRSFQYTLGPAGDRTRVVEDTGRAVDYTYDALFRLTGETIANPGETPTGITYTYDAAGNRRSRSTPLGTANYTYDANARLLQAGPASFTYDANGNLLSALDATGLTSYEYDGLNQLVRSSSPAGTTQFTYDAMGHRVTKDDAAGSTGYLIDPFGAGELSHVLRETNPSGSVDYVLAGGTLVSMRRPEGTSFYLHDARMSTRMLADAAGTLTDRYDYDAFGNVLGSQGTTPNEYRFDGQRLDPSLRLYHLRARYYDPIAGRFTTTDPFPGVIFEPASLHPYTYAYNDPVNKSDPSGKFTLAEQMTIAAAVGVYAGLGYAAENYYYYRSGELAFEAGVDAFFSVGSLTLDMLGVGAFVRTGMAAIARGIGEAFASRTLINQTARNIGKTAKDLVDESLERVLCRFNNPKLCTINAITQVGSVRRMAGPYVTFLRGKAIQAARAELAGVPVDVTAKQAAEVATEALETLVQKTTTLDDAAKILEGLLKWP